MLGSGFCAHCQETRVDLKFFVQGVYALTATSDVYSSSTILEHLNFSVAL